MTIENLLPTVPGIPEVPIFIPEITPQMRDMIIHTTWIVLLSTLLFGAVSLFIVAHILFKMHLKRKDKTAWSRDCSSDHPLLRKMYDENDDNTQVLYFTKATATFSSFTAAPETVVF